MLSQQILNTVKFSRNKIYHSATVTLSTSCPALNDKTKPDFPQTQMGNFKASPEWEEGVADLKNRKPWYLTDAENAYFKFFQADLQFTPSGIKKFMRAALVKQQRGLQQFNATRHEILGHDLSFAHFLLYSGGKVKFKGNDEWIDKDTDPKTFQLPTQFDPNYVLTEIDASGVLLHYEALENFVNLLKVKKVIFSRSPLFDDWYIDKISARIPNLQYLDISECPRVTERGLEALYKTSSLKTLIITNYAKTAAFELTCMMLEDCVKGLTVKILEPVQKKNEYLDSNDETNDKTKKYVL